MQMMDHACTFENSCLPGTDGGKKNYPGFLPPDNSAYNNALL